jgi:Tol biopolymer transport system component
MKRPLGVVAASVLLGALLIGFWVAVRASDREPLHVTNEPLPNLAGEDFVFAPEADLAAYCVNLEGRGELWVKKGDVREVLYSSNDMNIYNPVWSPDSTMVAFARVERGEKPDGYRYGTLCYVDRKSAFVDTGLAVSVNRNEFEHEAIQWSPDSRRILTCPAPIALWDVEHMRATILADIRHDMRKTQMASFSPSGRQVSFKEITDEGKEEVLVVDLDTLSTRIVSSVAATAFWEGPAGPPQWLSETQLVYLVPSDGERLALVAADLSTGDLRRLAFPAGHFVVSPDRTKIALIAVRHDRLVNALIDVRTGGSQDCPGTSGELMLWSNDSSRLLLFDLGAIRLYDVASRSLSPVISDGNIGWRPAWSPDSKTVAISFRADGEMKVNLVKAR